MTSQKAYENLFSIGKEVRLLTSIGHFLEWDQETFMPKAAIDFRSEQIELISGLTHREKTSERFKLALSTLINIETGTPLFSDLNDKQKANLREWRRDFLQETTLPNDFVKAFARTASKATSEWAEAKKNNTFETFAPHLESLITQCRQKADYIGYDDHPYDAFLSIYEPGITTKDLQGLFQTLKPFLKNLLKTVSESRSVDDSFLQGNFSEEDQMKFNRHLLQVMGADQKFARLDQSGHPFCLGLHPHDVRLTTHTTSSGFIQSISATLHEGGHALYELGLPPEEYGAPLGDFVSYGMHESQSRFWETFIGLGRPFWKFAYPQIQKIFPKPLKSVDFSTFYTALNKVGPSFIRIYADEISYILHIILRFEIELAFIEGKLEVSDLPQIWNQKMEESFGIIPKDDREGCLQDIHWAAGLFGYFPTYALGNLYAGQFFETFKKTFPDFEEQIAQGNCSFIRNFLKENIHRFGREYPAPQLIERISGSPLSATPYMSYLENKFLN